MNKTLVGVKRCIFTQILELIIFTSTCYIFYLCENYLLLHNSYNNNLNHIKTNKKIKMIKYVKLAKTIFKPTGQNLTKLDVCNSQLHPLV